MQKGCYVPKGQKASNFIEFYKKRLNEGPPPFVISTEAKRSGEYQRNPRKMKQAAVYVPKDPKASNFIEFYKTTPKTWRPAQSGATSSESHICQKQADTPNFLYAALERTACAPFFKERRMKFREPKNLHRKSGIWGTQHL
jgi:hypothetical protein